MRDRRLAGVEGAPSGPPQRGPHAGSTAGLVRAAEKSRLFEYIRQYWSEGGPPKAVVSLTFSNFSSATMGPPIGGKGSPPGGSEGGPGGPHRGKREAKEEGEGLVSRVSRLTGDAFMPMDRAFSHGVYGDYVTLTREITKRRCPRKPQQQQQQQQGDREDEDDTIWGTGSSTWFIEGHGGTGRGRREIRHAEVEALLNHFGLELKNPAVYLSQELAKTFLFRAREESLYKFYLCACGERDRDRDRDRGDTFSSCSCSQFFSVPLAAVSASTLLHRLLHCNALSPLFAAVAAAVSILLPSLCLRCSVSCCSSSSSHDSDAVVSPQAWTAR